MDVNRCMGTQQHPHSAAWIHTTHSFFLLADDRFSHSSVVMLTASIHDHYNTLYRDLVANQQK